MASNFNDLFDCFDEQEDEKLVVPADVVVAAAAAAANISVSECVEYFFQ